MPQPSTTESAAIRNVNVRPASGTGGGATIPSGLAGYLPVAAWGGASIVATFILAPRAGLILILDGWLPGALLLAAAGWGAWPVCWLGLGNWTRLRQALLATGLGLGILATAALVLGVMGAMDRWVALGLLGAGVLAGLLRVSESGRKSGKAPQGVMPHAAGASAPRDVGPMAARSGVQGKNAIEGQWVRVACQSVALAVLALPMAIMLVGATLPPGILWEGEARGYDVLEYHLQAPREYFEAGRIALLSHNVYASFPQQMEMLYYLLMHLIPDPLAAAVPAQLLHAAIGVLAVAALAAWQPTRWAAIVAAVVGGSAPWLGYVGCLAYVELGMLFFAAVAAGILVSAVIAQRMPSFGEAVAAGICAGLAAGCKYQGVVMVAGALGLAWIVAARGGLATRLVRGGVFGIAALTAFSPWLVRNAVFTGNPVYPFAYEWFGGAAWSAEQAAQWSRGHKLPERDASIVGRWNVAKREIWQSELFGPLPLVAGLVGGLIARGRRTVLLGLWVAGIVVVWVGTTHMPGRFAMPAIVPLALLAGGVVTPRIMSVGERVPFPLGGLIGLMIFVQLCGAVTNSLLFHGVYRKHADDWERRTHVPLTDMVGQTEVLAQAEVLNAFAARPGARLWLVGRADVFYLFPDVHYCVAFNRDPWIVLAEQGESPAACVDWLRSRNVTHVVFSWAEIGRLRSTYGFSRQVTHEWVDALAKAGLSRLGPMPLPDETPRTEVYEVLSR